MLSRNKLPVPFEWEPGWAPARGGEEKISASVRNRTPDVQLVASHFIEF